MEDEKFISGYCRVQDQARTVTLEWEDGTWYCDCSYPGCVYADSCPIGSQLKEKQEEHDL